MDKSKMNPKMGMEMMKKMMSGGDSSGPMQMCKEMMGAVNKTTSLAAFATPELQNLFSEWLASKEKELLGLIAKPGKNTSKDIAKTLQLSEESTIYLLARMAVEKKLSFTVASTDAKGTSAKQAGLKQSAKATVKKPATSKSKTVKKTGR